MNSFALLYFLDLYELPGPSWEDRVENLLSFQDFKFSWLKQVSLSVSFLRWEGIHKHLISMSCWLGHLNLF